MAMAMKLATIIMMIGIPSMTMEIITMNGNSLTYRMNCLVLIKICSFLKREKKKPKPESNFWTFLIGGAIIIIITLIAIIITLAVHRSRTSPSATQQQSYQGKLVINNQSIGN